MLTLLCRLVLQNSIHLEQLALLSLCFPAYFINNLLIQYEYIIMKKNKVDPFVNFFSSFFILIS